MAAHTIPAEELTPSGSVTEQEYLRTSYEPDCEYIDGRVEERNVGEYEHSGVQGAIFLIFSNNGAHWGVKARPECRLQVAPTRYRIPDVMVLRREQKVSRIVREAPLICIEVLSPEDSWSRLRDKLNDYLAMGVEHVWCFEPATREVRSYTAQGFEVVTLPELTVDGTEIRLSVAEVFAVLDEDQGILRSEKVRAEAPLFH
jgi:Uma2 family endonuclease